MNDVQRQKKMECTPASNSRAASAQSGKKAVIAVLAGLIALVMIVWFGFVGWGFISLVQWALDGIRSLLVHYF